MRYSEFLPPPHLRRDVKCIWHLSAAAAGDSSADPIIPDGCGEMILNLGDPFIHEPAGGQPYRQPALLCAGQLTTAIHIRSSGVTDIWGVRFQPWAAARFFGASARDIRDRLDPLGAVSSSIARRLVDVADARPQARYQALCGLLSGALRDRRSVDGAVVRAVGFIVTESGQVTVRQLAARLGVSERRLQLGFQHEVGMSPKLLSRIMRFQHALRLARESSGLSWSQIAHRAGYFDQAHLVHDSHDLAGSAPSALMPTPALTESFLMESPESKRSA